MNENNKSIRKYDAVLMTSKIIELMKDHYIELCYRVDEADRIAQNPDEKKPVMSPMEYAFTLGQLAELENVLLFAGALTKDECYQSRLFKKKEGNENV